MPTWIEEGKWGCKQCQTVNLGRDKSCKNCGSALESDELIYFDSPPSLQNKVTDHELIKQFSAGPDWSCKYCGGKQRNDHGQCVNCGSSKTGSIDLETVRVAEGVKPSGGILPSEREPHNPSKSIPSREHRKTPVSRRTIAFIVGAIFLFGMIYALFRTTEKELVVSSVFWQRVVEIERYRLIHENGFDDNRPNDAENIQSLGRKHHHYRDYQCGTKEVSYKESEACGQDCRTTPVRCKTNGNGSRTCSGGDRECQTKYCQRTKYKTVPKICQESIEKSYSSWDVWRWQHERNISVRGTTVDSVRWPGDEELRVGINCQGKEKERIGGKTEKYEVVFKDDDGDTYPYIPQSEVEFKTLPVGSQHRVKYSIALGVDLKL